MDDLSATIGAILNDPQKMEQLRAVAQSLGMNPPAPENAPLPAAPAMQTAATQPAAPSGGGFDPAAFSQMLQGFQSLTGGGQPTAQQAAQQTTAQPGAAGGLNLGSLGAISEIVNTYNKSDKNTDLLRSLKPHISSGRAGKVDDAIRLMQIIRVWPVLRDSGLLSSLGNLGGLGSLFGGGGSR